MKGGTGLINMSKGRGRECQGRDKLLLLVSRTLHGARAGNTKSIWKHFPPLIDDKLPDKSRAERERERCVLKRCASVCHPEHTVGTIWFMSPRSSNESLHLLSPSSHHHFSEHTYLRSHTHSLTPWSSLPRHDQTSQSIGYNILPNHHHHHSFP